VNTLVLVFHPDMTSSVVNRALAAEAEGAKGVTVRRMYDLYPTGVINVAAEQAAMDGADRIVIQFPLHWFSAPPLVQQWLDDVLTFGWAHGPDGVALLGKELMIAATAGAAEYGRQRMVGYSLTELLRPFQASAATCSMTYLVPFIVMGCLGIMETDLMARCAEYRTVLTSTNRPILGRLE
jgi:NAD(P)H oxidoreductase